jgi:hypothetical protein
MAPSQLFGGIDVAQAQLDIAVRPTGERWVVTNDEAGMAALVATLQAVAPTLMVLEATGGYQRACPSRWSILATRATWPTPRANWPRRIASMPAA